VLAAAHELAQGGMAAARALLQRGLRLNAGSSVELWREYVRLELGFVEAVRRRWDVLGISLRDDNEESGRGLGVDVDLGGQGQDKNDRGGQGERVDRAEEQVMGDSARRAIMDGAIVRQAIDSAAKGKPPGYVPPRTHLTLLLLSRYSHVMSLMRGDLDTFYCGSSATDDRAVSESAVACCRVPGGRGAAQLASGPSTHTVD